MRFIRTLIYNLGFRPKIGSIFHSPSRALIEAFKEGVGQLLQCPTCSMWFFQNVRKKNVICEFCEKG